MPLSRPFFILFSLLILGPIQVKQRPSGNYYNKHNFLGLLNLWEFIIHGHSVRDRSWLSDGIIHYQAHCWVQSTKCLYPNYETWPHHSPLPWSKNYWAQRTKDSDHVTPSPSNRGWPLKRHKTTFHQFFLLEIFKKACKQQLGYVYS